MTWPVSMSAIALDIAEPVTTHQPVANPHVGHRAADGVDHPGSSHEGKIYEITGPELLTFHDMTARIARATDQPLKLVDIPPEVAYQGMISSGVPDTQAREYSDISKQSGKDRSIPRPTGSGIS
jgi:uncharacterized protein YbjT (DUF2867 family)